MEVLSVAGLPAVLFVQPPTAAMLKRFAGYRGIGLAGVARSKDPQWMEQHLPGTFAALAALAAPLMHYKVCSTLDSAPHVGSIGKAIDIGLRTFDPAWVPLLIAAPAIRRYQLFGNLFASVNGQGYRLDRHPTMRLHPITPMAEADVRVHVSRQTAEPIGLLDYLALKEGRAADTVRAELAAGHRVLGIDVLDEASLIAAGELLWESREKHPFVVGSQGIEYALVAYWRSVGLLGAEDRPLRAAPAERIVVVSGSCSPVMAGQIEWGMNHGFELIRLDVRAALDEFAWSQALSQVTQAALRAIGAARDPIVFTARGPDDPANAAFSEALASSGENAHAIQERIGRGLGTILNTILAKTNVRRGIVAGGDTSSHGVQQLGIQALTLLASTIPGAGLFQAHTVDATTETFEIALKGGQMGTVDYFWQIKQGGLVGRQ